MFRWRRGCQWQVSYRGKKLWWGASFREIPVAGSDSLAQALVMKTVLFLGDIVGRPGRDLVGRALPALREREQIDLVVANGENAAGGSGLTAALAAELLRAGVDGITLGDHVWDQKTLVNEIDQLPRVCRPANLAPGNPGRDHLILEGNGFRLGVLTVLGRNFMPPQECPFRTTERLLGEVGDQADAWLLEIHAEATSEKVAFGWAFNGRAALIVGTHTHIPTADTTVLDQGTAYCTDAGMTGPYRSVIGREIEPVIGRFRDGMPRRFAVAQEDVRISGVKVVLDETTGRAVAAELLHRRAEELDGSAME